MKQEEIKKILDAHKKWIESEPEGVRADLRFADLSNTNLRNTNLRFADLRFTDLSNANLSNANLSNANLSNTNLRFADLRFADLRFADLRFADLRNTDLSFADLSNANLRNTNLRFTDLSNANLSNTDLSNTDLSNANLDAEVFCLDRIGSRKGRTTYDATNNVIWCGCFKGTFAEWCEEVRETCPDEDNRYRREYEAAIAYFKELAKIAKESEGEDGK